MHRQIGFCFTLLTLLALVPRAPAQREIVIEGTGSRVSVVNFDGFSAEPGPSRTFLGALRRNVSLTGDLREGPAARAEFRIAGGARVSGNQLQVEIRVLDRAGGGTRFQQRYAVETGRERTLARQIADELTQALTGGEGIASTRMVMVGQRPGSTAKELFSIFPDGGDKVQLTRFNSVVLGPRWAPDRRSVVYTSFHRGFPDVVRQHLHTGRLEILSSRSGLNAGGAISPDGRHAALVLSRDGKPELYVMDLRSRALTRLTNTPMSAKSSPSWSPDGRRIVFVSGHQGRAHLYIVNRDGGPLRRVSSGGTEHVSPAWGQNGLIAFTRRVGGRYQTAVLNPEDGRIVTVSSSDADYEDPTWAPNGRHIAVTRTIAHRSGISLLDTRGNPPIALTSEPGTWYMPAWTP